MPDRAGVSTSQQGRSDSRNDHLERVAWKFHNHRVPHVGGCHEFPNGGRGPRCHGPDPQDYEAAREVLYD